MTTSCFFQTASNTFIEEGAPRSPEVLSRKTSASSTKKAIAPQYRISVEILVELVRLCHRWQLVSLAPLLEVQLLKEDLATRCGSEQAVHSR